jgi:hypothetical protein
MSRRWEMIRRYSGIMKEAWKGSGRDCVTERAEILEDAEDAARWWLYNFV